MILCLNQKKKGKRIERTACCNVLTVETVASAESLEKVAAGISIASSGEADLTDDILSIAEVAIVVDVCVVVELGWSEL